MRNTLLVLNYQREIPAFMQSLLYYAGGIYDKIVYITPELYNDNRKCCDSQKLQIFQIPRKKWREAFLKLPFFLLKRDIMLQLCFAVRKRQLGMLIRQLMSYFICSEILKNQVLCLVKDGSIIPKNSVILSAWFSEPAYAAAQLKGFFSDFKVLSYAHSSEIDESRNPLMTLNYNLSKHMGCDEIVFISEVMRHQYLETMIGVYPELDKMYTSVEYLGSRKIYSCKVATASRDGKFRIVSCSSVTKLKRIHLIIEALAKWTGAPIHWTHLGSGSLMDEISRTAEALLGRKNNVSYHFTGVLTNREVQKFYVNNPADLFVNVSEAEGLPVSLMECMSYGIPAVATDVGGSREIVVPKKNGFLLPKFFEPQQLTGILEQFAFQPEDMKEKYREEALSMWTHSFDGAINQISFLKRLQADNGKNN